MEEENRKGATILFSSHILSEVQRLCNRVAIIKDGKLIALEKISDLKDNTYKKFKIETATEVDAASFAIPGVTEWKKDERTISFLFKGNINDVMRKIAELTLVNIWVEEPDLEEIFMHYYVKEDGSRHEHVSA